MKRIEEYVTEMIVDSLLLGNRRHFGARQGILPPLTAAEAFEATFTPGPPIAWPVAFGAIRCEASIDALMVATDLAARKDAPGIYQRSGDVWVFMGNPVMPGAWPRDYFTGDRVWDKNMMPSKFRSLYMCDPLPEDFPDVPPAALMGERACRECGCTEFNACRHPDHGNCWWVEPDLCSHCANGWGDKDD